MQTDWNKILSNPNVANTAKEFANGYLSGRQMEKRLRFTPAAGEYRRLIRSGGVNRARSLTRKALTRRGILA